MSSIARRAKDLVSMSHFATANFPERLGPLTLTPPPASQYVLRCPIVFNGSPVELPEELEWCHPLVDVGFAHQAVIGAAHPFAYLTVRCGEVRSTTDDEWHVDGFSTRITHVPEQNYVWCDVFPTEIAATPIVVPSEFDPLRHNVQFLAQDTIETFGATFCSLDPGVVYAMDPYVIHRRPTVPQGVSRTFVRLSCTAIPIDDKNNHINPVFGDVTPHRDGIVEFRDLLERYPLPT